MLLITNGSRGGDAARYRDALGIQIAAHEDDASFIPGGADLVLKSEELVRPDARVIRVGDDGDGATVVLGRKAGGVLFCGDLDLGSDAARGLLKLQFSAVLSARRPPIEVAEKVLVSEMSAPAAKYWSCRSAMMSGRVRHRRSLLPFSWPFFSANRSPR